MSLNKLNKTCDMLVNLCLAPDWWIFFISGQTGEWLGYRDGLMWSRPLLFLFLGFPVQPEAHVCFLSYIPAATLCSIVWLHVAFITTFVASMVKQLPILSIGRSSAQTSKRIRWGRLFWLCRTCYCIYLMAGCFSLSVWLLWFEIMVDQPCCESKRESP